MHDTEEIGAELAGDMFPGYVFRRAPQNVYWETTIACALACRHCRAGAIHSRDPEELDTAEARELMRDVRAMGSMLILTGGDPMQRPDIMELIAYGRGIGLPMSITPSTTDALSRSHVARFRELGVAALGVSLDGASEPEHDAFRGVSGTFANSMRALAWAAEFRIPVQVNSTVTAGTIGQLPQMYRLLRETACPPVRRWSLFLLVPVGRGSVLQTPSLAQVEELFGWVYETAATAPFHISTVEAPQYRRYWLRRRQAEGAGASELARLGRRMGFGIRDGNGVVFVSHRGVVHPAGFLNLPLGNVRQRPLSQIYRDSPELEALRNPDRYAGKCGRCEYRWMCGGSRARALAMAGDALGSDPLCAWQPATFNVSTS